MKMKIEVYIPDSEEYVINKVLELKKKRKLSGYIVELLKKEEKGLTEEKVIELIRKYADLKTDSTKTDLNESIQSVLGGLNL